MQILFIKSFIIIEPQTLQQKNTHYLRIVIIISVVHQKFVINFPFIRSPTSLTFWHWVCINHLNVYKKKRDDVRIYIYRERERETSFNFLGEWGPYIITTKKHFRSVYKVILCGYLRIHIFKEPFIGLFFCYLKKKVGHF